MAESSSVVIDWETLKQQLWLERPAKLRSELAKAQDHFTGDEVKAMSSEEVVHHVLNLRRTRNQCSSVTGLVQGFQPSSFSHDPKYSTVVAKGAIDHYSKTLVSSSRPSSPSFAKSSDDVFVLPGTPSQQSDATSSLLAQTSKKLEELRMDDTPSLDDLTTMESSELATSSAVGSVGTQAQQLEPAAKSTVATDTKLAPVPSQSVISSVQGQPAAAAMPPASSTDPMFLFAQMMAMMESQRSAEEQRRREEKAAEEQKRREEKAAEEQKRREEKAAEEQKRREEKAAEEQKRREEQAAALAREEKLEKIRREEKAAEEKLRREEKEAEVAREERRIERQEKLKREEIERQEKLKREEIDRHEKLRREEIERQEKIQAQQQAILSQERVRQERLDAERHEETRQLRELENKRFQAELDRDERAKANSQLLGSRLRKATDAIRGALYPMPIEASEVAPYLAQMDRVFDSCEVEEDLRANLLTPYLTERARKAVLGMTPTEYQNYANWKEVILREYRLTATAYRQQFLRATRVVGESCSQFVTRLRSMFTYYLAARKVKTVEELIELILADRLRDSLHPNSRFMIQDKEQEDWMRVNNMAKTVDIYEVSRGYNQTEGNFKEKREKNERTSQVRAVTVTTTSDTTKPREWKSRITCFNCNAKGHFSKECKKPKQQSQRESQYKQSTEPRKQFCFYCRREGHSTRDCRRRPQGSNPNACWLCGSETHKSRTCPKNSKAVQESSK